MTVSKFVYNSRDGAVNIVSAAGDTNIDIGDGNASVNVDARNDVNGPNENDHSDKLSSVINENDLMNIGAVNNASHNFDDVNILRNIRKSDLYRNSDIEK